MKLPPEIDALVRSYKIQPDPITWVRINTWRRREGLRMVDEDLNEEPAIPELQKLEELFLKTRNINILQDINKKREKHGLSYLNPELLPVNLDDMSSEQFKQWVGTPKSFYEEGHQPHRGTFEPGEKRPSWGLTPEEFTSIRCDYCKEYFKVDAARGVVDGIMILDISPGDKRYYHGYPDTNAKGSSCYAKAAAARRAAWEAEDD